MVSIIKNQLLKHLSRFTKNLSADKINLSTFKGEGELSNLELNEIVLTDLLELPFWLRLTKAWCNKVSFRIPWTKLKSVPILLILDEVNITIETCEELRSASVQGGLSSYASVPGKYSFIHKVIDGITVIVNTVNVTFNSPAFTASVQISRILVESKTPKFAKSELRMTRLKNPAKGQLLIFKELEWQTMRIEAKSTVDKNLTPLRLLTNQARCRIVIKKRISDCFILGSRLAIILDDLLWVLTDSQLKAALHFLDSLSGLIQKTTDITTKAKAARKLEVLPEYQAQISQSAQTSEPSDKSSRIFATYDVIETSYHFLSNQIVLHLCDDPGPGRSAHPNLKDNGGALQISVKRFQVDYYPYHLAKANRKHWPRYNASSVPHSMWQEQALNSFKTKFMDIIDKNKVQHTPLSRSTKPQPEGVVSTATSPDFKQHQSNKQKEVKRSMELQLTKLMTTCIIMRIEDFTLYRVTTSGKKQALKEFICGDRNHMTLPKDSSIVHAEFIYYYYPNDIPFPLPPPKFYVQLNPIQIFFDVDSCIWLNSFGLNLYQSLKDSKTEVQASNYTYIDVKIEAILPRVNFESLIEHHNQRDRPKGLSFQVTRATITNIRSLEQSSRADLAKCVDSFHMGSLFFGSEFPSQSSDFYIVTQKFLDHISTNDNIRNTPSQLDVSSLKALIEQCSREMLWVEAKDVWSISLDPVWADFYGARAAGLNKSVPFLDAVPIWIWVHSHMDPNSTLRPPECEGAGVVNADIHALVHISNLVGVQINHYQYLFLLRLAEDAAELATFLSVDADRILKVENNSSIVVGALIPQLEVTFVMPSQSPGKESSGGDVESFVPDSSSMADDNILVGSSATVWQNSTQSIAQAESGKKTVVNGSTHHIEFPRSYSMELAQQSPEITRSSAQQQQFTNINLQNNFNAGFSSMKKGFTNLMSSIDSALKPSPDDMSDTMSVRSDVSSDSEKFVLINCEADIPGIDLMFVVQEFSYDQARVEEASEVLEEESILTSASEHSATSSGRRKDLISVSTFKLSKVEFLQQSVGYSSSIKVQVGTLSCDDCSSIPWDEFQLQLDVFTRCSDNDRSDGFCIAFDGSNLVTSQLVPAQSPQPTARSGETFGFKQLQGPRQNKPGKENSSSINTGRESIRTSKFSTRSRAWTETLSNSCTTSKIKLRLDHTLTLPSSKSMLELDFKNRETLTKIFRDMLTVEVRDFALNLNMSTLVGLADLAEDEIIPIPFPIKITLENVKLHLNEDRPPVNITSPGPVPIDLNISQLYITRTDDGVFNIAPAIPTMSSMSSITSAQEIEKIPSKLNKQLSIDNEELIRRLAAFERVSEENRLLRKSKEETDVLRSWLKTSQDEVARLLCEKQKLLDEMKRMQDQRNSTSSDV